METVKEPARDLPVIDKVDVIVVGGGPAGMAENSPKNCIIIGPSDPTGNYWFPHNYLSLGIPFEMAKRMAHDLDHSFITKRSEVAYPINRTPFKSL